jgi:type VI protein secretion system component VasF
MTAFDYQAAAQERNRRAKMLRDAAPDLLAALIELQQMVEAGENNEGTHEVVREAIAKATGV